MVDVLLMTEPYSVYMRLCGVLVTIIDKVLDYVLCDRDTSNNGKMIHIK